jgi:hypothetical protein
MSCQRHLFLFIGADPNTSWLNRCVTLDNNGFVVTGAPSTNHRPILPLETFALVFLPSVMYGPARPSGSRRQLEKELLSWQKSIV